MARVKEGTYRTTVNDLAISYVFQLLSLLLSRRKVEEMKGGESERYKRKN